MSYQLSYSYVYVIFVITFWSWEVSAAHFNTAITIGSFIYNTKALKDLKANILALVGIILV